MSMFELLANLTNAELSNEMSARICAGLMLFGCIADLKCTDKAS